MKQQMKLMLWPKGTKIRKFFEQEDHPEGGAWYDGEVASYDAKDGLYFIRYEDGDEEELDMMEMKKQVVVVNDKEEKPNEKPAAWPIGTRIRKFFQEEVHPDGGAWYEGEVTSFDAKHGYYFIRYDDGDEEELDSEEMKKQVEVVDKKKPAKKTPPSSKPAAKTNKNRAELPQATPSKRQKTAKKPATPVSPPSATSGSAAATSSAASSSPGSRLRRIVNYFEKDDDSSTSESSSSEEEALPRKPSPRSRKRQSSSSKAKKPLAFDEDSDDVTVEMSDIDDNVNMDDDHVLDLVTSEEEDAKPKARRKSAKKKTPAKKPAAKKQKSSSKQKKSKDPDDEIDDDKEDEEEEGGGKPKKKSMAEAFKPFSTPLFWKKSLQTIHEEHEYLDPCGMEATDDIIDHLVGEQVLKLAPLLERALKNKATLGSSKSNPLDLGTVCSGTDAPALALTMVQEQMERFQVKGKLHVNHKFSCEKEPFKQSYLARNFDSVLYPDVVKMTEPAPRDVYGRPTEVPKMNALVAGTSCKNFSLLHSTKRLDIEDKGCSGETFLATVELILEHLPKWIILENVIGAPWSKMSEYITGR